MNPRSPARQLEGLGSVQLLRQLQPVESPPGVLINRGGREFWNFASNDYLGLASHPAISAAFIEGIGKFGTGSTASRLVTGTSSVHLHLEEKIASLKHAEAALTFTSGYSTALSSIPVIVGKGDFVILDKLSHASLIDGARVSGATLRVFPHNDAAKLTKLLTTIRGKDSAARILVITESIFSMDGDLCPLREILESCDAQGALLLLDEAHAIGIRGPKGMGLAEELGLQERVQFQMGTMSKALGLSGGYLAASRDWIDLIVNRARPFIYTTAPPPALAHAALAAFELIASDEGKALREKLLQNVTLVRPGCHSAILPVILGANQTALNASAALEAAGFLAPAIRYPTVPRNSARLRITISAAHPETCLRQLRQMIANL